MSHQWDFTRVLVKLTVYVYVQSFDSLSETHTHCITTKNKLFNDFKVEPADREDFEAVCC